VGGCARISSDPQEIANSDQLILPGVGGFGDAMAELRRRDLIEPIKDFVASERPFLGICLGLQLLFETGYEGGVHRGLGILPGEVVRFDHARTVALGLKVPHIGWNRVKWRQNVSLLDGIPEDAYFYFVHSYYVVPQDPNVIALECDYGGLFCAMIRKGNLTATQFHPEKSQLHGLQLLRNFARASAAQLV
jgi:glutamine amidotransferase